MLFYKRIGANLFESEKWNKFLNKNSVVFFIYAVLVSFTFHELLLGRQTLKWDAIDSYLPFRYYLGYSLQHGELPLWDPFAGLGSPILADPQSASWYFPSWLIGYFWGYDFTSVSIEYMFMLVLASLGFYNLLKYLKVSPVISCAGGVAFLFSGMFIGNSQHLTWIVSGAYFPWIIYYFLKAGNEGSVKSSIKGGFFLSLLLTGGYPAFIIILFYFCLISGLILLTKSMMNKDWIIFKTRIRNYSMIVMSAILLALPFLASFILFSNEFSRSGSVSPEIMLSNPFPPNASLSFLFPLSIIKTEYFKSDISVTNAYFSILFLIIFLAGIFMIRKNQEVFFLVLFFFFLLTSFGEGFFIRKFLYDYFPFMGLFRFPSLFRIFTCMSAIIFAALILDRIIIEKDKKGLAILKYAFLSFVIIYCIILVAALFRQNIDFHSPNTGQLLTSPTKLNIWSCIFIQASRQIIIIFAFTLILFFTKISFQRLALYLLLLVSADMAISSRLLAHATVFNWQSDVDVRKCNKILKELDSIDTHQDHLVTNYYNPSNLFTSMNNNIYYKKISFDTYNSFLLSNYESLMSKPYISYVYRDPIAYITCDVKLETDDFSSLKDSNFAVFYSVEPELTNLACSPGDTVYDLKMAPNQISLFAGSNGAALLVIKENYAKGWKAFINNEEVKIYRANQSLICLKLKGGNNKIELRYKPGFINYCLFITLFSFLAGTGILLFIIFKPMPFS
jgi:hypothetical protein